MTEILKRFGPYIAGGLVSILIVWMIFSFGSDYGQKKIQAKWDAFTIEKNNEILDLKNYYSQIEFAHTQTQVRLSNELDEAKEKYDTDIAAIKLDAANRLSASEQRGQVYKRLAEGSATDTADLASYATKLDRSLVEGIEVVEQLQATIILREEQLKLLGKQIISDRELINSANGDNDASSAKPDS